MDKTMFQFLIADCRMMIKGNGEWEMGKRKGEGTADKRRRTQMEKQGAES